MSMGWFDSFKMRSGIHSIVRHGQAVSLDTKTAEAFTAEFQKLMISKCDLPQQFFNCNKVQKDAKEDIHYSRREHHAHSQAQERLSHPLIC